MFTASVQIFDAGKLLGEVRLQTPVHTKVDVPVLPVNIIPMKDESLDKFTSAAANPTLWFRQPFALILLVRSGDCKSRTDYHL